MNPFNRIREWYRRFGAAPTAPPGLSFLSVGLPASSEFRYGVEILNDDQTPMFFALQALEEHAGLSRSDASVAVAVCHSQGGVLIPMDTIESAERIARCISQAAQLHSFLLNCRAVSGTASGR
jgi:ATP-dependent Clp protease adapter protein ClpS